MKINIIVGTESGESEMVAEDISESLSSSFDVSVQNMSGVDVDSLDFDALYLVVCSTYGDGELPASAKPFGQLLGERRPDLADLRYGVFARGDRTYANTYTRGGEIIDEKFIELGATRIGEVGREDASDFDAPEDLGVQWAQRVVGEAAAVWPDTEQMA